MWSTDTTNRAIQYELSDNENVFNLVCGTAQYAPKQYMLTVCNHQWHSEISPNSIQRVRLVYYSSRDEYETPREVTVSAMIIVLGYNYTFT